MFLERLGVNKDAVFVLHDWGGALGFHWANQHRDAVRGLAYMETFVRPLTWSDLPESFHPTLKAVRSEEGKRLVLDENMFIEKMLPSVTQRSLSKEEMAAYRRPFLCSGDSRLPTLIWPREVPIDGNPPDVHGFIAAYAEWLSLSTTVPKLFINAEPGVFITGAVRDFCSQWPNQTRVDIPGLHFVQEDTPDILGRAIVCWLQKIL